MVDIIESNTIIKPRYIGNLAQYSIIKSLGNDHLYPVFTAHSEDTKETYVIKAMDTNDGSFANECSVFQLLEHKNLVKVKDILNNVSGDIQVEVRTPNKFSRNKGKNAIVMELAENGDIFDYMLQGPLSEGITRYFFDQILDAVEYLHGNKFCHLDLKLENILLDKDYTIKLTDFGFASKLEDGKLLQTKVGTPSYRPPEMWRVGPDFKGYDGAKADIFQLGVLLYIFITGMPPFSEARSEDMNYRTAILGKWEVFWNSKERDMKGRSQGPKVFSNNFKDLVSWLLCSDEYLRPTIQEIRESDWYKTVVPASCEEVLMEMKKRKAKMM